MKNYKNAIQDNFEKIRKGWSDKDNKKLHAEYNDEIVRKTWEYQKQYGFETNPRQGHEFWNVEADAFKHAYMGADLYFKYGDIGSTIAGIQHESQTPNNPKGEWNMDSWNNNQGREIAREIQKEYGKNFENLSQRQKDDIIAAKVVERMKEGKLITNPNDDRVYKGIPENVVNQYKKWQDGRPTGQASNIDNIREFTPPYTRGDIKSMTPEEFQYYEKSIMQEVKQGNIIDDPRVKSTFAPEQKEIIFEENPDTDIKTYANKHIYTREEIGKMSTDKYAKHEPAILKQMKEKGIPTKRELEEHRSKTSGKSSNGNNADGRWVTINGNHVLIDK